MVRGKQFSFPLASKLLVNTLPYLSFLSVAVIKTLTKSNSWGRINLYHLTGSGPSLKEAGQELKQELEAETMEKSCLLAHRLMLS